MNQAHLEHNKRLALDFLNHAFSCRIDAALSALHPEATWWVLGDPQRLRVAGVRQGEQVRRLLSGVCRNLPQGMAVEVLGITAEGGRVAVELEAQGPFADGRHYRNRYHFLLELADGKITAVREYMDTLCAYDISQPVADTPTGAAG